MHTLLRLPSTLLLAGLLWQPAGFAAGDAAANGPPAENQARETSSPLPARGREHRSEAGTGASRGTPPRYPADTPEQAARIERVVAQARLRIPFHLEHSADPTASGPPLYLTTARLRI